MKKSLQKTNTLQKQKLIDIGKIHQKGFKCIQYCMNILIGVWTSHALGGSGGMPPREEMFENVK